MWKNKLVAIVNKSIETGTAMNALAHMCIGAGASFGKEELHIDNYVTKDQAILPDISNMPFIILRANSNKLKNLVKQARECELDFVAFTETMTVGTFEEQKARTNQLNEEDIEFYGVVLFGDFNLVSEMTKKFSLFK